MTRHTNRSRQLNPRNAALIVSMVIGCVPGPRVSVDPETGLQDTSDTTADYEPLIIGGIDWIDTPDLDPNGAERANSHAVAYLSLPAAGTRCTGFLIGSNILMTNEHCVPRASSANGATAAFERERGVPRSQWRTYNCGTFLGNDAALDFALLQCEGNPGEQQGVLNIDSSAARRGDNIYVIHQNCDYYTSPSCARDKKYSPGEVQSSGSFLRHNADTLGGSSGSPVFSEGSHDVIAIHHSGFGNNGNGRGTVNEAVPMSRILPVIRQRFPNLNLGGAAPAPGIMPDAIEPNNDEASATVVAQSLSSDQLTLHSGDVDIFRVDLNSEGRIVVNLSFSHGQGDVDMSIHEGALSSTARASATSSNDDEQLDLSGLSAGTYFVRVYGYNNATNRYAVNIQVTQVAPPDPDPMPDPDPSLGDALEPNNGVDSATVITNAMVQQGLSIHDAQDVDIFAITLSDVGAISAQINFAHSAGDIDVALFQGSLSGTRVGLAQSANDNETLNSTDLAAGTYFLRIYGYSGATNGYDADITVTLNNPPAPDPTPDPMPTDFEPNNTQAQAAAIQLPFSTQGLSISDGSDVDFFSFDTDGSSRTVAIDFPNAQGDLDLEIIDANGSRVALSNGVSDQERIEQALAAGTYFVRVYGYSGAINTYDLSVQ